MLGFDKVTARVLFTTLAVAAVLALLWLLRDLWFLLIVSLLFSYLLSPAVGMVERSIPATWSRRGWRGDFPVLFVYILLLAVLMGIIGWIGAQVVGQAAGLTQKLPELVKNREALLRWPLPPWLEPLRVSFLDWARGFLEGGFQELVPVLTHLSQQLLSGLGSLTLFLLVPVFSFYFMKDGATLAQSFIDRFPAAARATVEEIFADLHILLAQYMRALILLSAATFVSYEIFFLVMDVPYSTLLAALAAVLEFVPVVGPLTASAAALLVAGFSGYPHLLWIAVFLAAYRIFQDYVLQPYLMSQGIELHPLVVLVGILAGEKLAGIPGMLLAIPAIAALRIVYLKLEKTG